MTIPVAVAVVAQEQHRGVVMRRPADVPHHVLAQRVQGAVRVGILEPSPGANPTRKGFGLSCPCAPRPRGSVCDGGCGKSVVPSRRTSMGAGWP
ncbi:hypothetical protein GCM10023083_44440 [Streptomyces phyllanthi]